MWVEVKLGVGLLERFWAGARYFLVRLGLAERRVKEEGERERERFRELVGGPRYSFWGAVGVVPLVIATRGGDLEGGEERVRQRVCCNVSVCTSKLSPSWPGRKLCNCNASVS